LAKRNDLNGRDETAAWLPAKDAEARWSQRLQKQEEFITPTKPIRCHLQSGEQINQGHQLFTECFQGSSIQLSKNESVLSVL